MSKYGFTLFLASSLCLLAACASSPEPEPEKDDTPAWVKQGASEDVPPVFHAQSDAERLGRGDSREIVGAICDAAEDERACREDFGRRARGYRGDFSGSGAQEWIVVAGSDAVLISGAAGSWTIASTLEDVDVDRCQMLARDAAPASLLCLVPVFREDGYGLEIYEVGVGEEGELAIDTTDLPRVTDVDTVLFAGWRDEDGLEVRVHDVDALRGTKTLEMGGADQCRHRSFVVEAQSDVTLRETKACTTELTASQGADKRSSYESRLRDPIMKHNRRYVMCYQRELERLREEKKEREELIQACLDGEADDPEACPDEDELEAIREQREEEAEQQEEAGDAEVEDDEDEEPLLAGQVRTRLVIGSPGAPAGCEVVESTVENERVETCLCRELMETPFPPVPEGKYFDVTYPFDFKPDLAR